LVPFSHAGYFGCETEAFNAARVPQVGHLVAARLLLLLPRLPLPGGLPWKFHTSVRHHQINFHEPIL
jgi:hypothetical protein